jgi:hypothetical protein
MVLFAVVTKETRTTLRESKSLCSNTGFNCETSRSVLRCLGIQPLLELQQRTGELPGTQRDDNRANSWSNGPLRTRIRHDRWMVSIAGTSHSLALGISCRVRPAIAPSGGDSIAYIGLSTSPIRVVTC